ncbi:hypothetical protein MDAP_002469 [Mitosporidium daphniae]
MSCSQYDAGAGDRRLKEQKEAIRRYSTLMPTPSFMMAMGATRPLAASISTTLKKYRPYETLPLSLGSGEALAPHLATSTLLAASAHQPPIVFSGLPLSMATLSELPASFSESALVSAENQAKLHGDMQDHDGATSGDGDNFRKVLKSDQHFDSFFRRKWSGIFKWYRRNFTREETGEVLVDTDLVLWAYLQGGVFVTAGCFLAYFCEFALRGIRPFALVGAAQNNFKIGAPDLPGVGNWTTQMDILLSAQSAYFMAIVMGQIFTLFMVKKLYEYPFGLDAFRNRRSLLSIVASLVILAAIIFVPFVHILVPAAPIKGWTILMPIGTGLLMTVYEFCRRTLRRKGYFGGIPEHTDTHLQFVRTATASIFQ